MTVETKPATELAASLVTMTAVLAAVAEDQGDTRAADLARRASSDLELVLSRFRYSDRILESNESRFVTFEVETWIECATGTIAKVAAELQQQIYHVLENNQFSGDPAKGDQRHWKVQTIDVRSSY